VDVVVTMPVVVMGVIVFVVVVVVVMIVMVMIVGGSAHAVWEPLEIKRRV
jgi:hypothetical protein